MAESGADLLAAVLDALATTLKKLVAAAVEALKKIVRLAVRGLITPREASSRAYDTIETSLRVYSRQSSVAYQKVLVDAGVRRPNVKALPTISEPDLSDFEEKLAAFTVEDEAEALQWVEDDIADRLTEAMHETGASIRTTTYQQVEDDTIIGYRRVVHPELSKGGACGLCVAASTRMYYRPDLKPIHDRCRCTVAPVTLTNDPGDSLNNLDLPDLYKAAANSNTAADLKRVRVNAEGDIIARRHPRKGKAGRTKTPRSANTNRSRRKRRAA